ncbi:unnamed protein product, partial [Candidula unifasciata]
APKRTELGACVITCSPFEGVLGLPGCPEGYQCRSNGCGRTCQLGELPICPLARRQRCAPVLCRIKCPNGFALDENDCEICKCIDH